MTCTLRTGFSAGTPLLPLYQGEQLVLKTKSVEYANKYSLPKEKLLGTFRLIENCSSFRKSNNKQVAKVRSIPLFFVQNNSTTFCLTMFQLHFSYTSAIFQLDFIYISATFGLYFKYFQLHYAMFQLYLSFILATF